MTLLTKKYIYLLEISLNFNSYKMIITGGNLCRYFTILVTGNYHGRPYYRRNYCSRPNPVPTAYPSPTPPQPDPSDAHEIHKKGLN